MFTALALAATVSGPDPYEIYARARGFWAAQRYPHYLSYRVRISGDLPASTVTNTYASFADTLADVVHVRATSAEEAANPYVPHGTNVDVKLKVSYTRHPKLFSGASADGDNGDIHISKTVHVTQAQQQDILGVPLLSPAYSFGLRPGDPQERGGNASPAPGLKTIAAVTASRRDYAIRYDGVQTVSGIACYHLALTPLRDPAQLRLRELWIDTRNFATRQARLQGNFTAGPGPTLAWNISFAEHGGALYIQSEDAAQPVHYLGRTYAGVRVTFDDVQAAAAPDFTWSLSLFKTSGDVLREPTP